MVEMKIFEVWGCQRRRCRRCLGVCPHGHAQPPIAGWVVATLDFFHHFSGVSPTTPLEELKKRKDIEEPANLPSRLSWASPAEQSLAAVFQSWAFQSPKCMRPVFNWHPVPTWELWWSFSGLAQKPYQEWIWMDLQMPGLPGLHGIWAVAAFDTPVVWGGRLPWDVEPASN